MAYPLLIWLGISFVVEFAFSISAVINFYSTSSAALEGLSDAAAADFFYRYVYEFSAENSLVMTLTADALSAIVFLVFFILDSKKTEKNNPLTRFTVKSPASFIACVAVSIASCIFFQIVLVFIEVIGAGLGASMESYEEVEEIISNSSMLMQIITVVIVGPICEELLMRALIFKRMRTSHGFAFSAVLSSALFGLIHGNWVQFFYAFLVGFMLAYVYEMTGNILIPIVFHIVANGVSTLMSDEALAPYFTNLMYGSTMVVTLALCAASMVTGMIAMKRTAELKKSENY